MLKKSISYKDYNGNERNENFYFNLTEAELVDMNFSVAGGMQELLMLMAEKQDIPKIMAAFKTIILKAYGEKSPDGRIFDKSEALSNAFAHTEAFNVLYMELVTDAKKAAAFVNAIMPARIRGTENVELTPMTKEEKLENDGNAHLSTSMT